MIPTLFYEVGGNNLSNIARRSNHPIVCKREAYLLMIYEIVLCQTRSDVYQHSLHFIEPSIFFDVYVDGM